MSDGKRRFLMVLVVIGFALTVVLRMRIDPVAMEMNKNAGAGKGNELMVKLPGQFIVATMAGFREVIAGVLWVRADEFFHTGQFEAIIPIVRLVTWLDPHNVDVYTTGAWHLDYNFTDANELSDKRYIPASIALLKEGIANNPNSYDLYFELGWTHYYRKLNDHENALKYIQLACTKDGFDPNTGAKIPRPTFVDRMLAHELERCGKYKECLDAWKMARERAMTELPGGRPDEDSLAVCDRNMAFFLLRLGWRYGNQDCPGDKDFYRRCYEEGDRMLQQRVTVQQNGVTKEITRGEQIGYPADKVKSIHDYFVKCKTTGQWPGDAMKPLDTNLNVSIEKVRSGVIRITGTLDLHKASEWQGMASESVTGNYAQYMSTPPDKRRDWANGGRVYWMICDADYKFQELPSFTWNVDTTKMVQWDTIAVLDGKFDSRYIDLSKDKRFYPFIGKKYKVLVWLQPVEPGCDETLQDRVGYKGEAFRDKLLNTTMMPGFNCVVWEKIMDRDEIL